VIRRALDDPAELAAAGEIIRRALARRRAQEAAARETDEQATERRADGEAAA
jgi:hypothetical protein